MPETETDRLTVGVDGAGYAQNGVEWPSRRANGGTAGTPPAAALSTRPLDPPRHTEVS